MGTLVCRPRIWITTRMSAAAVHNASQHVKVGYVTDVEGDLDFWRRYCKLSDVIDDSAASMDDLRLKDKHCHLVIGGDSVDKSPGDLRFLRSIMHLKRRHPNRVHLVLGNRDINKLRLLAELSDAHMLPANQDPGVYWRQQAGPDGRPVTPKTFLQSQQGLEDTTASRLRYMLADNMGSPRAFEFRRQELVEMRHEMAAAAGESEDAALCDEQVLASYLESILAPDGLVRAYLRHGKLAVRIGDVLFVHGALDRLALGTVPSGRIGTDGAGGGAVHYADVDVWIDELNAFATQQVDEWMADCDSVEAPHWEGSNDRLGFGFFDRPGGG